MIESASLSAPIVPPSLMSMSSTNVTIPDDAIVIATRTEPIVPPSLLLTPNHVTIPVDAIVIAKVELYHHLKISLLGARVITSNVTTIFYE